MRTLPALLALPLLGLLAAAGEPAVKSGGNYEVEVIKNLAYSDAKDADPVRHKLDLYLPKGAKGYPVLVFVHGGGWTKGSKEGFAKLAHLFARNGVGTALTNYRLTPQVQHPGHAQDVAQAVGWVHKHIAKYGGRPDEIFLSGHSAGGHLVALLGTDPSYLKAAGVPPKDVKGVIPISGVFVLAPGRMSKIFGEDAEGVRKAAPLTHVKGSHPAFLIIVGEKDIKGFDKMADRFCQALNKAGCEARVLNVKDRNHGSIVGRMTNQADPATQAVLTFIARHSALKLHESAATKAKGS